MSVDLEKLESVGEAEDWLRCPSCGSYECRIQQDPDYVYFFCEECDMYSDFEIARWS